MLQEIKDRLLAFNYTVFSTVDDLILKFIIERETEYIKNFCNIETIPDTMKYLFINRCAGLFLFEKYKSGLLDSTVIDLSPLENTISEGDVSISYNSTDESPQLKFESLLNYLIENHYKIDLHAHRKLRWTIAN